MWYSNGEYISILIIQTNGRVSNTSRGISKHISFARVSFVVSISNVLVYERVVHPSRWKQYHQQQHVHIGRTS